MASLANVSPGASYPGLIKTLDNAALTSCVQLSDGDGNALPISISQVNDSISFGHPSNTASGCFSAILGGTGNCASGCGSVILSGDRNLALGLYSIAHGSNNCAINDYGVAIGFRNKSTQTYGFVFGACNINQSGSPFNLSTISGGYLNYNCGALAFMGGGINNRIEGGACNVLVGGEQNCIVQTYPCSVSTNFLGAGRFNKILSGTANCINSIHASLAGGCSNLICGVQFGTIPGGAFNRVDNAAFPIVGGGISAGGAFNTVSSDDGGILAGRGNTVTGCRSSVIGGESNNTSGSRSGISFGCCNLVSGDFSSIMGGSNNNSCLPYSGIFGCAITSSMACAFHANRLVVTQLPNSSSGLPSGALWYDPADGNRVKYVP
jgi:hypothetical protein